MRLFLGICVVVLVAGCGNIRQAGRWPAKVVGIENFSDEQKSQVIHAIAELNTRSGRELLSTSNSSSTLPISIRLVDNSKENPTRAGFATLDGESCHIEIYRQVFDDSSTSDDLLRPVLWHELGHCGGLTHDPDYGEIMYKSSVSMSNYSDTTVRRFIQVLEHSIGL